MHVNRNDGTHFKVLKLHKKLKTIMHNIVKIFWWMGGWMGRWELFSVQGTTNFLAGFRESLDLREALLEFTLGTSCK